MTFRVELTGAEGLSKSIEKSLAAAVTGGMREAAELTKQDLRAATSQALSGNALPRAWRSRVFPASGSSVDAAAWVETKAPKLIDVFSRGATIRARAGSFLAVPLPAAGRFGLKRGTAGFGVTTNSRGVRERITPGGFERRTGLKLRFVYGKGRKAYLVVDSAQLTRGLAAPYRGRGRGSRLYGPSGQTIAVFALVPQVTLRKRLDLDVIADRAGARVPGLIVKRWRD
ncbi:MAG: DUF6441 family protein [Brevundimonas sp.]|uniref:DUF6441 family protein n=1 Tax=Brevundimonas sp. TaxID=1871086 RepID=UPI002736357B|nr:DUF6441 family protein [Brevundimonas sp.]MDP3405046.1 DUF6441 family protein [Brevundimonas sp.]